MELESHYHAGQILPNLSSRQVTRARVLWYYVVLFVVTVQAPNSHAAFSFAADLFDILLPMLNIYQEFVRNHQYSLQVLANCKQNRDFDKLLKQYEANPACEGRMLETFLTYPMFQVSHLG